MESRLGHPTGFDETTKAGITDAFPVNCSQSSTGNLASRGELQLAELASGSRIGLR